MRRWALTRSPTPISSTGSRRVASRSGGSTGHCNGLPIMGPLAAIDWQTVLGWTSPTIPRCLPVPVLALKAQTPHHASIVARDLGTGPPRCSRRRGCSVALDPLTVPSAMDGTATMAGSFDELHLATGFPSALRAPAKPVASQHCCDERRGKWLSNVFTPKRLKRHERYRGLNRFPMGRVREQVNGRRYERPSLASGRRRRARRGRKRPLE